ncbi:MAG: peptidoglycan-binding protein, partial [Acidimicrobiia bacterium]
MRGVRLVIGLILAAGGLIGLGAWLGSRLASPEEAALRKEPERVAVTDPLRWEVLERVLLARGELRPRQVVPVPAPAVPVPVITWVAVAPGQPVEEGDVLVEVAGRPVIVLSGDFRPWRDFLTNMSPGRDVAQLQDALARLGLYGGEMDGSFGPATREAVEVLYDKVGYPVSTGSEVMLPAAEVVFLPGGRGLVEEMSARVGDLLLDGTIVIGTAERRVELTLDTDQRRLVKDGVRVVLLDEAGRELMESRVAAVEDVPVLAGEPPRFGLVLAHALAPDLPGQVVVRLILASSEGPVLSASPAAVFQRDDGSAFAVLLDGATEKVIEVEVGMVSEDRIEIRPTDVEVAEGAELVL